MLMLIPVPNFKQDSERKCVLGLQTKRPNKQTNEKNIKKSLSTKGKQKCNQASLSISRLYKLTITETQNVLHTEGHQAVGRLHPLKTGERTTPGYFIYFIVN